MVQKDAAARITWPPDFRTFAARQIWHLPDNWTWKESQRASIKESRDFTIDDATATIVHYCYRFHLFFDILFLNFVPRSRRVVHR